MTTVSLVFPTYNERENILIIIPRAKKAILDNGFDYEIIVVDDSSTDHTAQSILTRFKNDPKVKVIRRQKRGYATAIRAGIEASRGQIIGSFDADYLGPMEPLNSMLREVKKIKQTDLMVASRYVARGGMELGWRNVASRSFNLLMNSLGYPLTDNTSGFYLIRRTKLLSLNFDQIFFGYGDCFFRMAYLANAQGFKISEVPVYYPKRVYGQSKTRLATIFFEYLYAAIKFKLQHP